MSILKNYHYILNTIKSLSKKTNLVVVTKNQDLNKIKILINENHFDFGENRVQEAYLKWKSLLITNSNLKLHLIGKLQSNKAKDAFEIFDYIHTLDNEKLAKIFSDLENNSLKKIKYFVQVNTANESQKNGIKIDKASEFINYCNYDLKLNVIGLMCIPPVHGDPTQYFKSLAKLANNNNLNELSMGMSNDYACAVDNGATFIRIGNKIFGQN